MTGNSDKIFVEVAFNLPLPSPFTYSVPVGLKDRALPGMRALAPFGARRITGFIVAVKYQCDSGFEVKPLEDLPDNIPALSESMLDLTRWLADYYQCAWGEAIAAAIPAGLDEAGEDIFSLTETGMEAFQSSASSDSDRALLEVLRERPGSSRKQLQRRLGANFNARALNKFKSREWIRAQSKITRKSVDYHNEKFVRALPGPSPEATETALKRSPRQLGLHRLLSQREYSLTELKQIDPGYAAPLRQLKDKELAVTETRKVRKASPWDFLDESPRKETPPKLTPEQETACKPLLAAIDKGAFQSFLIQGVTGSGKTEIYLRCIQRALEDGKTAIMMVPEISLTPQTAERFRLRFGNRIAILHSGLSRQEKFDEWNKIQTGQVSIALGARSSVFAPLTNIGVIVIDEEHDGSYKQDSTPRYHARDVALMRAKNQGAVVILGTATPSLESHKNAVTGKYQRLVLTQRVNNRPMPWIQIVDMRQEKEERRNYSIFSIALKNAIRDRLDNGEQTFLFLNRRGAANYVFCKECGYVFDCSRCSVSMTFHSEDNKMRCHYCNGFARIPRSCPDCKGEIIKFQGFGTQKLEAETRRLFPGARVFRLDRDTAKNASVFETMRDKLNAQEIDILIGTQMIAKGHDFPNVTLVGVTLADLSLNVPDFRSCERTFQLVTQVAGRAGRGDIPGKVIVQTNSPDHFVFPCIQNQDFDAYAEKELDLRKKLRYPPFVRTVSLEIEDANEQRGAETARRLRNLLKGALTSFSDVDLLGPAPAVLYKISMKYRWRLLIRAATSQTLQRFLRYAQEQRDLKKAVQSGSKLSIDVDPINLL
ncbi:MAG: primosomal protein N' [Candidatus Nitrohelix vancouverensis]|uniref:Replication restart protein PriA n=1 Tax=Candidatus Nitrohelix vancouverensis TaxID=2705534 RepID=A0A7T0G251_9BACT|nr:MAG: primosomal protein N' [Candidatus Nitrohelix vancouverensis]